MNARGLPPELGRQLDQGSISQYEDVGAGAAAQFGPSMEDQIMELTAKVSALRRDKTLLLTQLARAAKCLNAVHSENQLLKTEVASLQPGPPPNLMR